MLCLAFTACAQKKDVVYRSPAGYNLDKPKKYTMPQELEEISGIAFYKGDPKLLYAEQDEEGYIFSLKPGDEQAVKVKFGKKGDYEDIAIAKEQVIILRSDGTLFTMPFTEVNAGAVTNVKEWKDLLPKAEYESMYADENTGTIYILCKYCGQDKKSGTLTGYILRLTDNGTLTYDSHFTIGTQEIAALAGKKSVKFAPSALTRNKQKNKWFILSSVNKLLVVADESWKIEQVFHLDAALFTQPEGITFDAENNLYISNEAGNTQYGTVLKFPYDRAVR